MTGLFILPTMATTNNVQQKIPGFGLLTMEISMQRLQRLNYYKAYCTVHTVDV